MTACIGPCLNSNEAHCPHPNIPITHPCPILLSCAGTHFSLTMGTLVFQSGETRQVIRVPMLPFNAPGEAQGQVIRVPMLPFNAPGLKLP